MEGTESLIRETKLATRVPQRRRRNCSTRGKDMHRPETFHCMTRKETGRTAEETEQVLSVVPSEPPHGQKYNFIRQTRYPEFLDVQRSTFNGCLLCLHSSFQVHSRFGGHRLDSCNFSHANFWKPLAQREQSSMFVFLSYNSLELTRDHLF